jgi:hypothetical protein
VLAILLRQNLWALSVRKRLRYFMQRDGMSLAYSRSALSASSSNFVRIFNDFWARVTYRDLSVGQSVF